MPRTLLPLEDKMWFLSLFSFLLCQRGELCPDVAVPLRDHDRTSRYEMMCEGMKVVLRSVGRSRMQDGIEQAPSGILSVPPCC